MNKLNFLELVNKINNERKDEDKQPLNVGECKNVDELLIELQLSELSLNKDLLEIVKYYDKESELKFFYQSNLEALNNEQKSKLELYIGEFSKIYKDRNFTVLNKLNKLAVQMIDFADSQKSVSITSVRKFDRLLNSLRDYHTTKNINLILKDCDRSKKIGIDSLVSSNLRPLIKSNMKFQEFKSIIEISPILNRAETLKYMLSIVKANNNKETKKVTTKKVATK